MERYSALFNRLAERKEGAFVPFVTLGDPGAELSLQIIDALVAGGADALELGFPFSDPLADGPTIQAANLRAFSAGMDSNKSFDIITQVRNKYPDLPIGLLIYAFLVISPCIDAFYDRCQ